MSQQDNSEICPACGRGRMVWTGFASVRSENDPPFDVTEDQRFRQCDVCGHRDRSNAIQERQNVTEDVHVVLTKQDNESPAATQQPTINTATGDRGSGDSSNTVNPT